MTWADTAKALGLLVLLVLLQVTIVTPLEVASGHPDVVLAFIVALALLRGPMLGAVAGFWAGLLLDSAALAPPGLSSLVLTLAGYWAGRFGLATTRSSPHPPLIAVGLATIWVAVGSTVINFLLGQSVPASELFGRVLLPTLALNVLIMFPVYRLAERLFPIAQREGREMTVLA
jgi:rod shape-determining protein MreD